jgi:hypothetical protein
MQRTTVYFSAEDAARVDEIHRKSRLETSANVVAAALEAYLELIEFDRAGGTICVKPGDANDRIPYSVDYEFCCPGFEPPTSAADDEDGEAASRNFVVPRSVEEKIIRIRELTRYQSPAEIIRAAVISFDELVRINGAGGTIIVSDRKKEARYSPFAPLAICGLTPAVHI